ncbi:MAG: iron complex outermembrane receptor protein [Litorivivens sp.]|jgi:iron complex outermembrane receptor protein
MKRRRIGAIGLIGIAFIPFAQAQLEEVIVTAQKREQSVQDVPMAVTAIGGDILENNEINSISDLTKLVPSLKFTPGDNPQNSSIRVRGVGTSVYSSAVEPNVSVVIDSVPLARTSLVNFDFADVERVEVLRGPQGTLFGKNASAGLVHVITRDPHSEFEARGRFTYEDSAEFPGNFRKTQLSLSGPLTDSLGARLTVFEKRIEGHIEDLTFDDTLPSNKSVGFRTKFVWDTNADLSFKLIAEHQNSEGDAIVTSQRSANPNLEKSNDPVQSSEENRQVTTFQGTRSDLKVEALTLSADWRIGDHVLTSVTGYRQADIYSDLTLARVDGVNLNLAKNGGPRDIKTFTQELRLSSSGGTDLDYTFGALWFKNSLGNDFLQRVTDVPANFIVNVPLADPLDIPGNIGSVNVNQGFTNKVKTENLGIFGQATWHGIERWHATLGLRYIDEVLSASYSNFQTLEESATGQPVTAADSSLTVPETEVSDSTVTGTTSLQYDWSEHSVLYATYSRGYRGRAFDITSSSTQKSFDNPLKAETAVSFELGIKSRLFDNRLELNATVFDTVFSDFQAQIIDISGGGVTSELRLDNAGELETRGVEIDFKAKPTGSLMMFGSLLYNEAVFNEFITKCFSGQRAGEGGAQDNDGDGSCDAQDVSGGVLSNAPEWSGSLSGRYDWALGESGRTLYGQLTGRYQSEVQFQSDQHPMTIQDAYDIWDLRVGYIGVGGRLEVAVYAKNLFQQSYASSIVAISLVDDRRDTMHYLSSDADRTLGASIAYQW